MEAPPGPDPPYEDAALRWARAHPRLAEQCLRVPPSRDHQLPADGTASPHHMHRATPLRNFEDYWCRRGWRFPVLPPRDAPLGRRLATHVLSAPLTVAAHLVLPSRPMLEEEHAQHGWKQGPQIRRWCCLGARAEASLPVEYWRELLLVSSWMRQRGFNAADHISIEFMGPEISTTRRSPVNLQYRESRLTLTWAASRKFHDVPLTEPLVPYDAFILLNPGLGHPHLASDWRPTLDLLVDRGAGGSLLLLTAHSALDARRDAQVLAEYFGSNGAGPKYSPNAFASRITYRDPFDASHMVQPNHYVAMVQLPSSPKELP